VIAGDPNVQSVELVAAALGNLCNELILVGGCAASLLIDAPSAPPPRVTYDVDLLAVVAALHNYHALEEQFGARGFKRDTSPDAPICRWRIGAVKVDLMPTDETVLGFANRWYAEAAATATRLTLPSGAIINLISAPAFLATKFEAFHTRGNADMLTSHDFEDIINVVEGHQSIVKEVDASGTTLRKYLGQQFAAIMAEPDFTNALPGLVAFDELHEQRLDRVRQRIAAITGMGQRW
jgi:predicted nucleotidyltransferase